MRNLKFRAFDKYAKKMLFTGFSIIGEVTIFNGLDIMIDENPISTEYSITHLERLLNLEISQFTGLTLKNKMDVYEGDLVKAKKSNSYLGNHNDLYRVDYDDNLCQFVLLCVKSDNNYNIGKIATKSNHQPYLLNNITEVVGNIFENPELYK